MLTRFAAIAATLIVLGGCAAKPQLPVPVDKNALSSPGRVGVVMTKLPELTTYVPGAGCLLCVAVANGANSELTQHAKSLPVDDIPPLKEQVAKQLRDRGIEVIVIAEPIDLETVPKRDAAQPNTANRDFNALGKQHGVQKLVVLEVSQIGFERTYSGYFPTSEPKGLFRGSASLVNLGNHVYEWYLPVNVLKSTDKWDEPPKYPGLTNAYFQAIESGKDAVVNGLKN